MYVTKSDKYHTLAVVAFHMESASRSIRKVAKGETFVSTPEHEKYFARRAIGMMKAARLQNGIYNAGDFIPAHLP